MDLCISFIALWTRYIRKETWMTNRIWTKIKTLLTLWRQKLCYTLPVCSQKSWAYLKQINLSYLQFLILDGWNQFVCVYRKWVFCFLALMLLPKFERNDGKGSISEIINEKYYKSSNNLFCYFCYASFQILIHSAPSVCWYRLLIQQQSTNLQMGGKGSEEINYLLQFAGAQLRSTTELILMNKWARQHWPVDYPEVLGTSSCIFALQ